MENEYAVVGSYENPNTYGKEKGSGTGFGIASFILGVVSLLMFCVGINWITGILAIIFGIVQLVKHRERGLAVAGMITAGISFLLAVTLYIALAVGAPASDVDFNKLYEDNYGGSNGGKSNSESDHYNDYYYYYDLYKDYFSDYYGSYDEFYKDYFGSDSYYGNDDDYGGDYYEQEGGGPRFM